MSKTFTLTDEEVEALRDLAPRVTVANLVQGGANVHLVSALQKLMPDTLPLRLR